MPDGPPTPDINTPPSARGPEAPPPGGEEAQSPLRVVPSSEETARMVAAKEEADRAQQIQKQEGPREALREVAGEQTPGFKKLERTVEETRARLAPSTAPEAGMPPGPEIPPASPVPPGPKVEPMTFEDAERSAAETRDRRLAEEAAAEAPAGEEAGAQESETAGAEKPKVEAEAEAEATEAPPAGAAPDETPPPATTAEEAVVDEVTAAAQEAARARREWLDELRELDPEELSDAIEDKKIEIQMYRQGSVDLRNRPERQGHYQNLKKIASSELRDMRKVHKERFGEKTETGGRDIAAEERAQAQREAKEKAVYAAKITKMSAEDRATERLELEAGKEALQEALAGQPTQTERSAIEREIGSTDEKLKALDKVESEMAPKDKEAKEKKEQEAKEAEEKDKEKEKIKTRAETASVKDLPFFRDAIAERAKEVRDANKEIDRLEQEMKEEADPEKRGTLKEEHDEWRRKLIEAGKMLKVYKDAYNTAKETVATGAGKETALGPHNIKDVSPDELENMSDEDRQKWFLEAAKAYTPNKADILKIMQKIDNKINPSPAEMAQFIRYASDELAAGKNRADVMKMVHRFNAQWPEVSQAILTRVANTKAGQDALKENFPIGVDRLLKFAKENKGWLMLILAILAGTVVGPVALASTLAQNTNLGRTKSIF